MSKITKTQNTALKAKIAFEAAKAEHMIAQLAGEYGVHQYQFSSKQV